MPLYEYQCLSCRHRFEVIQKFSDPQIDKCPKCGKLVERLLSSPAIQFKGTGWYVTDYARRSGPAAEKPSGAQSEGKDGKQPVTEASASSEKPASPKEAAPPSSSASRKKD